MNKLKEPYIIMRVVVMTLAAGWQVLKVGMVSGEISNFQGVRLFIGG